MKCSPGLRKTAELSRSRHQQLNIYALEAAGVGLYCRSVDAKSHIFQPNPRLPQAIIGNSGSLLEQ